MIYDKFGNSQTNIKKMEENKMETLKALTRIVVAGWADVFTFKAFKTFAHEDYPEPNFCDMCSENVLGVYKL